MSKSLSFTVTSCRSVSSIMLNFSAVKMSLLKILFCENHLILTFESTHPLPPEILGLFVFPFGVTMTRITFKNKKPQPQKRERTRQTTSLPPTPSYLFPWRSRKTQKRYISLWRWEGVKVCFLTLKFKEVYTLSLL